MRFRPVSCLDLRLDGEVVALLRRGSDGGSVLPPAYMEFLYRWPSLP